MKFTPANIFIYALVSTFLIFSLTQLDISPKKKIIDPIIARLLSTKSVDEMLHDMCEKSSSDLEEFYKNKDPSYKFNPEGKSQLITDLFLKIVNGSQSFSIGKDEIIGYSKENIFFIVIIVFLALLILLWIPFIICVSTKRCCCVSESCSDNLNTFLIMALFLSVGVMICSFIGYSKNTNVLNGIFGLGCSVLKIENHIVKGDDYNLTKPYWVGLTFIIEKLSLTEKEISKVISNYNKINQELHNTEALFDDFNKGLTNEWNDKQSKQISNPNKDGEMYTPSYINKYGPVDNTQTCLGALNKELSEYKDTTITKLGEIINVINIEDNVNNIRQSINKTSSEINKTVSKIENSIVNGISDYYDQFEEIDSIVRKIMNIFFSLNLALIVFFAVSVVVLLCCKCGGTLICISWFFIYIFLLASVIIGCGLGIAASLVKDASSAVKYIMDNTNTIKYDKVDILESCINGNGSLASTYSIHFDFDTSLIDNIYNIESNISEGINNIQKYNSISIQTNEELYNQILTKPKSLVAELLLALNEIKKYINSEAENSVVDSSTPIYDRWEVNKEDCGGDYYPPKNNLRNLIEENENKYQCLVITEWSLEQIQEKYSGIKSKVEGINIIEKVKQYHNSINNFMKDNTDLMNNVIEKNGEFNSSFNGIKESEIALLNDMKNAISPLRQIFEEVIDNGSIFEIMNCKFIGRDLNKAIEVLYNDIGGTFSSTSNIFLAIAGCEFLLTIFVLVIMKSLKASTTEIPNYSKYSQMVEK